MQRRPKGEGYIQSYLVVDRHMIASSTMKGTVSPSRGTKKVYLTIPTEEELKAILGETKAYDEDPKEHHYIPLYPLFLLATASGLRIGEILGHSSIKTTLDLYAHWIQN